MKIFRPRRRAESRRSSKNTPATAYIGTIAVSLRGRDAGSYVVIIGVCAEGFVEVADGRTRSVQKPKKKNLKHLQLTDSLLPAQYLKNGVICLTDRECRALLSVYGIPKEQEAEERGN